MWISKTTRNSTAKAAAFGPVDMKPDDRGGRAFINVRSPDVEGSGGDFEAQADEHQSATAT